MSADGDKCEFSSTGGRIYTSTDIGVSWMTNNAPNTNLIVIALSADGVKQVAAANNGGIYTSTDGGVTWATNNVPTNSWSCVVSSADGSKSFAAVYGGGIWTLQTTPTPQLNLAPADTNLAISWTIPSTNFVLQQSADLVSWADVTNAPALNLTNLQNQVTLSPSNRSGFFRLSTP
jgi:photosystem II stability/assembly factor-like uncharacterized protein